MVRSLDGRETVSEATALWIHGCQTMWSARRVCHKRKGRGDLFQGARCQQDRKPKGPKRHFRVMCRKIRSRHATQRMSADRPGCDFRVAGDDLSRAIGAQKRDIERHFNQENAESVPGDQLHLRAVCPVIHTTARIKMKPMDPFCFDENSRSPSPSLTRIPP